MTVREIQGSTAEQYGVELDLPGFLRPITSGKMAVGNFRVLSCRAALSNQGFLFDFTAGKILIHQWRSVGVLNF